MSLDKLFDGKGTQYKLDSEKIGDLAELNTEEKSTIVSATNEVNSNIPKLTDEQEGHFLRVIEGKLVAQQLIDVSKADASQTFTDYVILPGEDYQATCDAVRVKTGKSEHIKSGDLAEEISGITPKLQDKNVKPDLSKVTVEPDEGYDGLSIVHVEGINLQSTTVTPSTEVQEVVPDEGYDGLSKVVVEAVEPSTGEKAAAISIASTYEGSVRVNYTVDGSITEDTVANGTPYSLDSLKVGDSFMLLVSASYDSWYGYDSYGYQQWYHSGTTKRPTVTINGDAVFRKTVNESWSNSYSGGSSSTDQRYAYFVTVIGENIEITVENATS